MPAAAATAASDAVVEQELAVQRAGVLRDRDEAAHAVRAGIARGLVGHEHERARRSARCGGRGGAGTRGRAWTRKPSAMRSDVQRGDRVDVGVGGEPRHRVMRREAAVS